MTASTDKYGSGTAVASENSESLVTHPEEEGDTEDELMNVTVEALVGETKYVQEAAYEVSPTNASPVTFINSSSVYPSYSGLVTRDSEFSEAIAVPDMELPVPAVIFLAS